MKRKNDSKLKKNSKKSGNALRKNIIKVLAGITRIPISAINDDVLIVEELSIDSLKAMEMIALVENRLNIQIDEKRIIGIKTVGEFIDLVLERIA